MEATLNGRCACGAVRYRLVSEPMFVHCCHCQDCQRETGSAFVLNALIETDRAIGKPSFAAVLSVRWGAEATLTTTQKPRADRHAGLGG
jgi:hypothetical protein